MQENQEKRMIRVSQLKLPVEHSEEQFYQKIEKSLKIKRDQIKKLQIVKKSIDAMRLFSGAMKITGVPHSIK